MSIYLHKVKSRWQPGENTLAYFPINNSDTSSVAYDGSGNNNDATWYGTASYEELSSGKRVVNFSGSNGLYLGNKLISSQPYTINIWVYKNGSQGGEATIMSNQNDTSNYGNVISFNNNNQLQVFYGGGNSSRYVTTQLISLQDNNWQLLTETVDGNTIKKYIDGKLVQTVTNSVSPNFTNSTVLSIGFLRSNGTTSNYRFFNGKMSDIVIENKARTEEEIEDYYMLTKGDYHTETQWEVNGHTLSYFPLKTDSDDVIGTRGLTLSGVTISDGVANVSAATSYMQLSNTIGGTNMTASLWYYPTAFNTSGNGDWNTLFARNGGTYHHLLISGGNSTEGTAGRVGFWNNSWTGSSAILDINKWYNIIITKSGTNEKIYVNGALVLDSNSSFDNAAYQLGIIANHSNSSPSQGAHGKISEVIFEDKVWSADEVLSYYYQTRNDYVDDPWYPVKEYEVQNIYIGHLEGYQPNENTIIYFPLTDDIQDHSGKSVTVSTTGSPAITTLDGVKCCYFDGSSTIDTSATVSDTNTTWSAWVYQTANGSMFLGNQPCGIFQGIALSIDSNGFTYYVYGSSSSTSYGATASGTYTGGWHHFLVANKKIYIDGVYKTTTSGSYQVGGTQPVNLGGHNANSSCTRSKITGYMGETFIESGEWTAEQVAKYYNDTKASYGL